MHGVLSRSHARGLLEQAGAFQLSSSPFVALVDGFALLRRQIVEGTERQIDAADLGASHRLLPRRHGTFSDHGSSAPPSFERSRANYRRSRMRMRLRRWQNRTWRAIPEKKALPASVHNAHE